jgi:Rod binding domain-containing protein
MTGSMLALSSSAPPTTAELADPRTARAWHAAQEFEAMALGEMLGPMFETVDSAHGLFGGGDGEAAWRPMMTQEIAKQIARTGGIGLAVPVFRQMLQMQEAPGGTSASAGTHADGE